MSKHLVKILSICALVVLMAVTVVGAAICVTEAVGVTLTVANASVEATGAESNVSIYIKKDGKEELQEDTTFHLAKYTEVRVEFKGIETGYDFLGWYEGNYDVKKDKPESNKISYTFEVKKNMKLSAVAELKTFNVTFTGTLPDGTPVTDAGIAENQIFTFGQDLPRPESTEENYFYGWTLVDDEATAEDAKLYNIANFDTKSVTLKPKFGAQQYVDYKINVAFKAGSTETTTLTYNMQNGISAYSVTRPSYKLVGIEFNGVVYNYDEARLDFITNSETLGEAVRKNGITEVNATAVWECDYDSFTFDFYAVAYYYDEDLDFEDYWQLVGNRDGEDAQVKVENVMATFTDREGVDNYDLNEDMFGLFIKDAFTDIKTVNGDSATFAKTIRISIGDAGYSVNYNLNGDVVTFRNVLTFLERADQYGELNGTERITVEFVYEI